MPQESSFIKIVLLSIEGSLPSRDFITYFSLFIVTLKNKLCVCTCVCVHLPPWTCGCQRKTEELSSSSTSLLHGFRGHAEACVANAFPQGASQP